MIDFVLSLNDNYKTVEEHCKKKKWKIYDNIHNNLNLIESNQNQKIDHTKIKNTRYNGKDFKERTVDLTLKIFFLVYKFKEDESVS